MSLPTVNDLSNMGYVSRAIGYVDQPVSGSVDLTTTGYVSRALPFLTNAYGNIIAALRMMLGMGL